MNPRDPRDHNILVVNGGSSSIRFDVYALGSSLRRGVHGKLERIGQGQPRFSWCSGYGERQEKLWPGAVDYPTAIVALLGWLDGQGLIDSFCAIGHRVVHGMQQVEPVRVSASLIAELRQIEAIDPDHLPGEIQLIEAFLRRAPELPQVACFDTAFHAEMPRVAQLMAIPHRLQDQGVRRYGFHGLSYAYLMEELARAAGTTAVQGRVVLAHLGNGASMAAVHEGRSVDTSMGFTPASGLPMGTRPGDLDPGLAPYLQRSEGMTALQFDAMVNHQSGLLGVSGVSADMRDLLAREADDPRCADAVALFCYQAKKTLGAYAAALGGLDTLVFSGGIGENAPAVRARICEGLGFLGIELDASRNAATAELISSVRSRVAVWVLRSDEQQMIARSVCRVLDYPIHAELPS